MARFPSKVDAVFGVLLGLAAFVPVLTVLVTAAQEGLRPFLLPPALVAGLVVVITLRTHYDITEDELIVRSGPFRWRVALPSIQRLRATRTLLSAPALSMDRMEVHHGGGVVVISPRDTAGFIRTLQSRAPQVELEGLHRDGSRADARGGHRPLWALAVVPASILAIVGVVLFMPVAAPTVTLTATSLVIEGNGRESVPLNDIESASLEETLPPLRKSFGFNSYTALRGRFRNPRLGEGRVWVRRNDPPYILARTLDGFLLLNLSDPDSTRAMYEELSKRLQVIAIAE